MHALWDYPAAACVFFVLHSFPFLPDRGSRLETEFIGFAGRGARTLPPSGAHFPFLPGRGSRPETEFIGLAGRGARTLRPPGAHFSLLSVWGSRLKTEIIGFARRGARTLPPSGSSTPHSFGSGFALENRIHWLCGDAYTNREPVDLEKTAELKNQLLLLFWRYWILTRIKERSWATVAIPVAQLLLRRGSIIPITYSSDLS